MRNNIRIIVFTFSCIVFIFFCDIFIFGFNNDRQTNFIQEEVKDDYYGKKSDDICFSEKPYSRPLFMSSRLHSIDYNPVALGMNKRESDSLLRKTSPFSCPKFEVIDFQTFTSKCEDDEKIMIFEPNASFPENYGSTTVKYPLTEYFSNFAFSPSSEFGYVKCGEHKTDVFLRNVFNKSISENAKNIEEELKVKYDVKSNYRPLTVIMFIIDSVSRRSFYRNMNETIVFFNESIVSNSSDFSKHFVLYDFLGNNAIKDFTRSNMPPFIFGISLSKAVEQEGDKSINLEEDFEFYTNRQKNKAIWSYFKDKGFVTMHLNDVVTNYLPNVVGHSVLVDHQVSNVWTLGNQYYGYSDSVEAYYCIGSQFSHQHSLKYLSQFLENYKDNNKFAYVHISVAHELSGTRLSLSDKDVKNFLEKTLQKYTNSTEDLFILFAADHGRYKSEFASLFGRGERSLPFHFVISNKDFIERNDFHKNLDINSRRLLSRYDWYKTLKHLANVPYTEITTESQEYKEIETDYKSLSLLIERSSRNRTCDDLGIEQNHCLSDPFIEVSTLIVNGNNIYSYFLNFIKSIMEKSISKKLSFNCNTIEINKALYIGMRKLKSENKVKPINILEVFTLKNNSKAVFMIDSSITNKDLFIKLNLKTFHNFESYEKFKEEGHGKSAVFSLKKIWSLTRLDIVDPGIKKVDKACCEDSTFYNYNYLYSIKGQSCLKTCSASNLECVDYRYLESFIKFSNGQFVNTEIIGELNSLEIVNSTLIIGRYDMCDKNIISDSAICYCAQIE